MKFLKYINGITINLSKDKNIEAEKFLIENKLIDDVQSIINDLNKQLNLSKNKHNFKVSFSNEIPALKHRNKDKVVQEWLNSNEKLTAIKKSFLTYINDLQFK